MWEIDYISSLNLLKNKVNNFIKYDYDILLNLSFKIGKVFFIGGWFLFAFWILGRYTMAIEFRIFLFLGALWAYIGFLFGIFAIILLIIYTIIRITKLRWLILTTLLLHLLNLVSIFAIFGIHTKVMNKVFIKFTNNSKLNNIEINIKRENSSIHLGKFQNKESEIFIYKPKIKSIDARAYLEPEVIKLEITINKQKKLIDFPIIPLGTCYEIKLNENFELKKERRIIWDF